MPGILIADDHADLSEMLRMLLTMHKFETAVAATKTALNLQLVSFKPDLILLDVRLGRENGRTICQDIKQKDPTMLIILISASPELLEDFQSCLADETIEKPFDIYDVIRKIHSVLDKGQAHH